MVRHGTCIRSPRSLVNLALLLGLALWAAGCAGFAESFNPRSLNLTAHRDFTTIVQEFEPTDGHYEKLKMLDLTALCGAYLETKRYTKLFPCLDAAEAKYATGDKYYHIFDFSYQAPRARVFAFVDLGQFDKAAREADRLMDMLRRGGFRLSLQIDMLEAAGIGYAMSGKRDKAAEALARLNGMSLSYPHNLLSDSRSRAVALVNIALHDNPAALKAIDYNFDASNVVLKAIAGGTIFSGERMQHDYLLARSLFETGGFARAREVQEKLLALPNIADSGDIYWALLHDYGRVLLRVGETDAALAAFRQSIAVIEEYRSNIPGDSGKIGFVTDKQAVYGTIIDALAQAGDVKAAYEYLERSKARALVDLLAGRESFAVQGGGAEAPGSASGQDATALLQQLARLEDRQALLDPKAAATRGSLRSAVDTVKRDMARAQPELASLVTVTATGAESIQAGLGPDETLLEFYYHGDTLYAFRVTREGIALARLDGRGLEADVRSFREAVGQTSGEAWRAFARALHDRLITPVPGALNRPRLIIVAHGALHYLPWSALHDGQRFLVDRAALTLLPSASVMQFLAARRPATARDMLILGNPDLGRPDMDLPGAEAEARAIKGIWPDSTMLMRKAATKAALTRAGGLFRVIHVAAHGEFASDQPLASRLLLAPEGPDDGRLTAGDLYGLRLGADLVTLSACETGLGKVLSGDDVVGLTRGFLYAGAGSIVASLWPVSDDETRLLMTSFYRNLKIMPKAEALRQAQLETRKKHPHPFYWSAFQLTGLGD